MVTLAALPEWHQMTESNLQVGLETLDLAWEEPQRLVHAIEEDPSQRGAAKTAMMQHLVKVLEDDYTELKGSQCLQIESRPKSPGTLAKQEEEHINHLPHCFAANLAFYQEQLELAQQAQDLTSRVYEEAKADGDPEVEQFLQICDQCDRWLEHRE